MTSPCLGAKPRAVARQHFLTAKRGLKKGRFLAMFEMCWGCELSWWLVPCSSSGCRCKTNPTVPRELHGAQQERWLSHSSHAAGATPGGSARLFSSSPHCPPPTTHCSQHAGPSQPQDLSTLYPNTASCAHNSLTRENVILPSTEMQQGITPEHVPLAMPGEQTLCAPRCCLDSKG